MCLQKLVFSTLHKIILLKTNFWTHTVTYLKFVPSNFFSKQKILQQKFCSSHYPFAFHNQNLAKKLSDFDEILTSKSTQMVFWVVKFLSKSDNFLAKFLNYLKKPPPKYFHNLKFYSFLAKFSYEIGGVLRLFFKSGWLFRRGVLYCVAFVKMFTEIDFQPQGKSGLHLKSSGFSSKLLPSDFYQHL